MAEFTIGTAKVLWDMIEGLLRGYIAIKKDFLEQHVEPLQSKMMEIHNDYIHGFQEARRYLADGTEPPERVIEFLRERRREFESKRKLSLALSQELTKAPRPGLDKDVWELVVAYCQSIVDYHSSGSEIANISWYSNFIEGAQRRIQMGLGGIWTTNAISGNPRWYLIKAIDYKLDTELPWAFKRVLNSYAALRSRLV